MYEIENFIEFNGQKLGPDNVVLVWSKKSGYFFALVKDVKEDQKIIAVEL